MPDKANERGGIQAVPILTANGSKCAHVKAGEKVQFEVKAEVPKGAGKLTFVEWSFEGEQDFPEKGKMGADRRWKQRHCEKRHISMGSRAHILQ